MEKEAETVEDKRKKESNRLKQHFWHPMVNFFEQKKRNSNNGRKRWVEEKRRIMYIQ